MDDDILEEVEGILSIKSWSDIDFDTMWSIVRDHWSPELHHAIDSHPEMEQKARKFYEKATPKWFGEDTTEESIKSLETDQMAFTQATRMAMVYGFICGYVICAREGAKPAKKELAAEIAHKLSFECDDIWKILNEIQEE